MLGVLVSLSLLIQGIPVQQGGTVTGVLRDSQGKPVAGIRMAAVARGDTIEEAATGAAMAGLAETDEQGRFTLESIPPGRYSIAAGRLDLQTYYPGTPLLADATIVTITPGATLSGINFVLNDASFGRAGSFGSILTIPTTITIRIPVHVNVESGGKLPLSSNGRFTTIRLQPNTGNSISIPVDDTGFSVSSGLIGDFRVSVEGLPDTHFVKSILYGSTDITQSTFRLTAANFPAVFSLNSVAYRTLQLLSAGLIAGTPPTTAPPSPASPISITLGTTDPSSANGVRVSGRTGSTSKRLIYISGRPGVLFSDGTFEFRGVPAGRHLIATVNNPSTPLAAVVVVGGRDISGIELKEVPLLPGDVRDPKAPLPAGEHQPGTIVPLARVTGIVLEETTKAPISEGNVVIKAGDYSRTLPIDADGHFETFHLLPGSYDFSLQIFGHSVSGQTITIEDKDIKLELSSRRFY